MSDVVIENPVINSPFEEPARHYYFGEYGITNQIIEERRDSSYWVPIPEARRRGRAGQLAFDELTRERIQENRLINDIRARVQQWRKGDYRGVSSTTRKLLEHWHNAERPRRFFFAQLEAVETAIYLNEVANQVGDGWIENALREFAREANPDLFRMAFKMATGSGKTIVMALLMTYHALNKAANPQSNRYADGFLIVTPGITIRDRLRVLLPSDPQNYYQQWQLVPSEFQGQWGRMKVVITNYHAFQLRDTANASKLTKQILGREQGNPFVETPSQMVSRVCRALGSKKNIIVLNDEAHHCYDTRSDGEAVRLQGDERMEAARREQAARVWANGLYAVQQKLGVKLVYDLSATPFFLRGSGYSEGTLFPWVVSDFSLIDAIESGIVKVPRVPIDDDAMTGESPTYRDLWPRIAADLPRKGRSKEKLQAEPTLPMELEGALRSLYGNYEKLYRRWEGGAARQQGATPPVFIIVAQNTNISKLLYDYVAGWEKKLTDEATVLVPGQLPLFSNVEDGRWRPRPLTILVDSEQLESGEALTKEFREIARHEIEEFKAEYQARFPGRSAEELTDEAILREVMNTVGKPGKLGEQVRCVVSVSMLTEGWDANSVTHILGVRAFGTQLLCEQVVGRALRRVNYVPEPRTLQVNGHEVTISAFPPEYGEVYGVPFSFIPAAGSSKDPQPQPSPTRVRALPERAACEIRFPRVAGYRYELADAHLHAQFSDASRLVLSTQDVPTRVETAPIVGEHVMHDLYDVAGHRIQEVDFGLAKLLLEKHFRTDNGDTRPWLFPQLLRIVREWREGGFLICKDHVFPQMLLFQELKERAAQKIYSAIVQGSKTTLLKPILKPYNTVGTTALVDFDTRKAVYATRPDRCHLNYVVADTASWEQKLAQELEGTGAVRAYVKNQGLGFTIPYTTGGHERHYLPDFIARVDDGRGAHDPLHLIIEVTGARDEDKVTKVATAQDFWVPAVTAHGSFGRWEFREIRDPWNVQMEMRALFK